MDGIYLLACFLTVEGNQRNWWKLMQTQREHAKLNLRVTLTQDHDNILLISNGN